MYFLCCSIYFCVLCIVCFVSFSVLFVCICVLYYCYRVATQLQLNISYYSAQFFQISERAFALGSFPFFSLCTSGKSNMQLKMSVQYWWNGTDRGKQQYWEETPSPSVTLKTKIDLNYIQRQSSYLAVNTSVSAIKSNQLILILSS